MTQKQREVWVYGLLALFLAVMLFWLMRPLLAQTPTRYPVQFTGQYRGSWTYNKCDQAVDKKIAYFSVADGNKGHTPGTSPAFWALATASPPCAATVAGTPAPVVTPPVVAPPVAVPPVNVPAAGIAPISHAHSNDGGPTPAIATTGANFAVMCGYANAHPSDTLHNTWTYLGNSHGGAGGATVGTYVAFGLVTGPADSFSLAADSAHPFTVMTFNGVASGPDRMASADAPNYPLNISATAQAGGMLSVACDASIFGATPAANVMDAPYTVAETAQMMTPGQPFSLGASLGWAVLPAAGVTTAVNHSPEVNGEAANIATFYGAANPVAPKMTLADPLPEGVVGVAYTAAACPVVTGGVQPFTFAMTGLAPGMSSDPKTGCPLGSPTGTATDAPITVKLTDAVGQTVTVATHASVAAKAVTLAGTSCPTAKQLQPYKCTALAATGGIGPLHYATSSDPSLEGLPGGMAVDPATGTISSARVMDQGDYSNVGFSACDGHGGCAAATIALNIDGDNTFGGVRAFPKDSVWHLRVTNLPDDTSIRSRVPGYYAGVPLQASFGPGSETGGFAINTYPANTPMVPVRSNFGGNQFTLGPLPCNVGMEADRNAIPQSEATGSPDVHVLGMYAAGKGADGLPHAWQRFESYNTYPVVDAKGGCSWGNLLDPAGAGFGTAKFPAGPDTDVLTSYEMPNPGATTNAGGTPLLAVTYDEAASGDIGHPLLITVQKLSQFYSWPGTASAPGLHDNCPDPTGKVSNGDIQPWDQAHPRTCYDGNGQPITTPGQTGMVAGMVYHLPPATPEPAACSANPILHTLFRAVVDYGVMATDNGLNGRVLGTKDNRWMDWGTINGCLRGITLGQLVAPDLSRVAADPSYQSSKVLPQYVTP